MTTKQVSSRARRTIRLSALLCCLLAMPLAATALPAAGAVQTPQSPPADERPGARTLQQCIDLALEKNHGRIASRYGMEIAEAQHRQALSAYWPQVGVKANFSTMDEDPNFIFPSRSMQIPASTISASTPMGPMPISIPAVNYKIPQQNVKLMDKQNFVASLNATLPLYTGGQISAVVRQAEQGMKAAREEARRTDLQVVYDTTRYYYGAVLARELLRIGRDALARMEVTLELTENLYTRGSGKVRKTDYLRNKTVVAWLRGAVTTLEANEQLARAALTNSMGMEWDYPVEPAPQELPFSPATVDLRQLVSGAYSFNPDWARLEAGLEAAAARIDGAKSGHLPRVGLFGNLTRIENSYDKGIVSQDNRTSWTIGIGLELPLFNGMRTTSEVREARARLEKLRQQQLLLKEGIALQVKHIFIQLMSAQQQKASSQVAADSSEENRALNERAYQEELVETKDVIEAQLVESLMKAQYQKTLFDNLEARANLDFVVGRQISELMASTPAP